MESDTEIYGKDVLCAKEEVVVVMMPTTFLRKNDDATKST